MQIFVEAKRNIERVMSVNKEACIDFAEKNAELQRLASELRKFENDVWNDLHIKKVKGQITEANKSEYKNARAKWKTLSDNHTKYHKNEYVKSRRHMLECYHELIYWQNTYRNGSAGTERQRREFMMCCPADDCRGFLSTAYKCGTCDKYTCSECLEVLGIPESTLEALKEAHTCKSDSIESAKLIKKETRPCPKCGARIFKIDGCDQMYCTNEGCHTAFSWDSGHIVTGRIHNPHYYEWLRRNGGEAPREMGDIPCGGIPDEVIFMRSILRNNKLTNDEKNHILEIHRNIYDIEARLAGFPARPPALLNKEHNVAYLMNEMTEDEWKRRLELTEAAFNRKKEIGQLLQTFIIASTDVLQNIARELEDPSKSSSDIASYIQTTSLPNLESLRNYTNDSYRSMAKSRRMAVPQIGDRWQWLGIRALYKSEGSKNAIVETEAITQTEADETTVPPV
jgi:hypothetical protein